MTSFRHKDKDGERYFIVAFGQECVTEFGKTELVTVIYCKDKAGNPFKCRYEELFRYE